MSTILILDVKMDSEFEQFLRDYESYLIKTSSMLGVPKNLIENKSENLFLWGSQYAYEQKMG